MICKDDFTNLQASNDLCFVVRPEVPDGAETSIFGERAEVCVDICLDYDAESCNCETFANAVHGKWGEGVQASFYRKYHLLKILLKYLHQHLTNKGLPTGQM